MHCYHMLCGVIVLAGNLIASDVAVQIVGQNLVDQAETASSAVVPQKAAITQEVICPEATLAPATVSLLADHKRPVTVDAYWIDYSQWVKDRTTSKEMGTGEHPLEVPLVLEKILVLDLLLSYVHSNRSEHLEQEQMRPMSLQELVQLHGHTDLLKIDLLKKCVEPVLIARLKEQNALKEFVKFDQFLGQLGLTQLQSDQLASVLLSTQDKTFFRSQLYTDYKIQGSPIQVAISQADMLLIVSDTGKDKSICSVLDVNSGQVLLEIPLAKRALGAQFIGSPEILLWLEDDVQLYNMLKKEGTPLSSYTGFPQVKKKVTAVNVNDTDSHVAVAMDGQVFLCSLAERACAVFQSVHDGSCKGEKDDAVTRLFFVAGGEELVACSQSGAVTFYRCSDGRCIGHAHVHTAPIKHHYAHGARLITLSKDNKYCVWDSSMLAHDRLLKSGEVSDKAHRFISKGVSHTVEASSKIFFEAIHSGEFIDSMPFLNEQYKAQQELVVGADWKAHILEGDQSIELPGANLLCVALSERRLLVGGLREAVRLWHFHNDTIKEFLERGLSLERALVIQLLIAYKKKQNDGHFLTVPHVRKLLTTLAPAEGKVLLLGFPELHYGLGEDCLKLGESSRAKEHYQKAAVQERSTFAQGLALYRLGSLAYKEKKYDDALGYFLKASKLTGGDAWWWLGELYNHGWGTPPDFDRSYACYVRAEKEASTPEIRALAMYRLGRAYHRGEGVPVDFDKAYEIYNKAVQQPLPLALQAEGHVILGEISGVRDKLKHHVQSHYEKAYACAQTVIAGDSSEHDKARALCTLGRIYGSGFGVIVNSKQAETFLLKADALHDAEMQPEIWVWLADHYLTVKNYVQARSLAKKVTRQTSDLRSQAWGWYLLGLVYDRSLGDACYLHASKAASCYEKVVQQNVNKIARPSALAKLGDRLATGKGVQKNLDRAIECEEQAINQVHAPQTRLEVCSKYADMNYTGKGYLSKNLQMAVRYYTIIAQESEDIKQLEVAWCRLGELYVVGTEPIKRDDPLAMKYFALINERAQDRSILASAWFRLGEDAYFKNKPALAVEFLKKAAGQKDSSWAADAAQKFLAKMDAKK